MTKKSRCRARQPAFGRVQKALGYINDVELFFNETDTAVPLLIEVFKKADADFKDEIIFLLGSNAHRKVCAWLYAVMADSGEKESTRQSAALQISVTAAILDDTDDLTEKLLVDTENPDPVLRRLAVLALGWEGNHRAMAGLAELTRANDPVIRKTAAVALTHLQINYGQSL